MVEDFIMTAIGFSSRLGRTFGTRLDSTFSLCIIGFYQTD